MALGFERQAQIAFKNLLGKSQVQKTFGVNNESFGYLLTVPSTNVWSSTIPRNDPDSAINNQIAVKILADLVRIDDSATSGFFLSYKAVWRTTPSVQGNTLDPKTNLPFQYGQGSLSNVAAGDTIYDFIPDSYGFNYGVIPYTSFPSSQIPPGDTRDWVFQYNGGILYQDNVGYSSYAPPTALVGFYYIGNKLSSLDQNQSTLPLSMLISCHLINQTGA